MTVQNSTTPDFLTAEEISALENVTRRAIIKRIQSDKYPGARKISNKRTATWIVPRASYEATLPPKTPKPKQTKKRTRPSLAAKARA